MLSEPDYGLLIEALTLWQGLHRRLAASTQLVSWEPATDLVGAARELDNYAYMHLDDALKRSDAELFPLRDPLRLNLGEHRWLSTDREESYSDWLAWILQGMADAAEILPLFALEDDPRNPLGRVDKIRREASGEHGRTDVEAWFGDRGLLLIETKVRPTDEFLAAQLTRYEKWVGEQRVGRRMMVLLGTEEPVESIGRFRFTDWRTLCIRLRGFAKRAKESDLLRSAAILMFCGAVEQNLLGMSSQPLPFHAMTTVDYLREWRDEG